jgi:hypothetical protein
MLSFSASSFRSFRGDKASIKPLESEVAKRGMNKSKSHKGSAFLMLG